MALTDDVANFPWRFYLIVNACEELLFSRSCIAPGCVLYVTLSPRLLVSLEAGVWRSEKFHLKMVSLYLDPRFYVECGLKLQLRSELKSDATLLGFYRFRRG